MADLFDGLPPEWLQARGADAEKALTPQVMDWMGNSSIANAGLWHKFLRAINPYALPEGGLYRDQQGREFEMATGKPWHGYGARDPGELPSWHPGSRLYRNPG